MNFNYYEYKNSNNKDMYDGLREYCLCEHINEEHIRSAISKTGTWKYKLNIKKILIRFLRFEKISKQKVRIERVQWIKEQEDIL